MSADLKIAKLIRNSISKDQLIDIADEITANRKLAGSHALEMGLRRSGAARIAGLATYEMNVQKLADLTNAHGGQVLEGGCIPGTALRIHKLMQQYGPVLVVLASAVAPGTLPSDNITHRNGATINYRFGSSDQLPGLEGELPEEELICVMILIVRDSENIKKIDHIAIGVIEGDFSAFAFYQELDEFLSSYGESDSDTTPSSSGTDFGISLKDDAAPFAGDEAHSAKSGEEESGDA